MEPCAAKVRGIARQREQHRFVASPDLSQKERIEFFGRLNQPGQGLPLVGGQGRHVGGEIDRREARGHRSKLLHHGIRHRLCARRRGLLAATGDADDGGCECDKNDDSALQ
jgi:hypothetical protein